MGNDIKIGKLEAVYAISKINDNSVSVSITVGNSGVVIEGEPKLLSRLFNSISRQIAERYLND